MNACNECLEKNWSFEQGDGFTLATCLCGNEVELEHRVHKKQTDKEPCRKCKGRVVAKIKDDNKIARLLNKKNYVYRIVYYCLGCKTIYLDNQSRVYSLKQLHEHQ